MPVIKPEHLLDQAQTLIQAPPAGAPRQADLRRAISSAYYGVFHAVTTAAADQFIGIGKRTTPEYGLVYRSVGHRELRELCTELKKQTPSQKYASYLPAAGIGADMVAFSTAVVELQEKRHSADYDPTFKVSIAEAALVIKTAHSALSRFEASSAESKLTFVTLLAFKSRSAP